MRYLLFITFFTFSIIVSNAQQNFSLKENMIDSIMTAHITDKGKHPVHSFLLYAKNETTGFEVHKGKGTIGRNDQPIDADYQYNVASITKTMVATIILQLEEEGKLNVNDRAGIYLDELEYVRFNQIHIMNDTSYSNAITINMLLHHTSGIADIFTDAATKFNISVLLHKKRKFTTEMIMDRFFKYNLNEKPFNKPGKGYHYSDINYMLLGFIIEQVTGKALPAAIRERILVPLKMNDTYFEFYEPATGNGKRIDAFLNGINMTEKINTSYEWGGGGIVSTTSDMAIFIEALFHNKLYQNPETLNKMIDFTETEKFGVHYGMGIYRYDLNGRVFYGHGGFYGSILAYDPVDRITLSANIGQANPPYDTGKLVDALLNIIMSNQ
jgi:D-alanyl-D-alanine carboxypeptidase